MTPAARTCSRRHFRTAQETLPQYLAETPRIVNAEVPGTGWSELGELKVGS